MGTMDPRIDAYIANSADFAQPILVHLRSVVHAACPDVEETLKWRLPTFMHHGILCGMAAFKHHAAFNLWKGALIVGSEKDRAAMGQFGRLTAIADLPSRLVLTRYIKQAMVLNEDGVKAPRTRKPGLGHRTAPAVVPQNSLTRSERTLRRAAPSMDSCPVNAVNTSSGSPKRSATKLASGGLPRRLGCWAEGTTRNSKYE